MNGQGFLWNKFGRHTAERKLLESSIELNDIQKDELRKSGERADTANLIAFISVVVGIVGIIASIIVVKQAESLEQRMQNIEQELSSSKQP